MWTHLTGMHVPLPWTKVNAVAAACNVLQTAYEADYTAVEAVLQHGVFCNAELSNRAGGFGNIYGAGLLCRMIEAATDTPMAHLPLLFKVPNFGSNGRYIRVGSHTDVCNIVRAETLKEMQAEVDAKMTGPSC